MYGYNSCFSTLPHHHFPMPSYFLCAAHPTQLLLTWQLYKLTCNENGVEVWLMVLVMSAASVISMILKMVGFIIS
jgi:hypothetical protein